MAVAARAAPEPHEHRQPVAQQSSRPLQPGGARPEAAPRSPAARPLTRPRRTPPRRQRARPRGTCWPRPGCACRPRTRSLPPRAQSGRLRAPNRADSRPLPAGTVAMPFQLHTVLMSCDLKAHHMLAHACVVDSCACGAAPRFLTPSVTLPRHPCPSPVLCTPHTRPTSIHISPHQFALIPEFRHPSVRPQNQWLPSGRCHLKIALTGLHASTPVSRVSPGVYLTAQPQRIERRVELLQPPHQPALHCRASAGRHRFVVPTHHDCRLPTSRRTAGRSACNQR